MIEHLFCGGLKFFLGEQCASLYDSGYIKYNNSHKHPLPAPPPEPPPTLPRQPWSQGPIEEQIDLINFLETCLEDYNREGYPSNRLDETIGQLTSKTIRVPMRIRKFIKEQSARLSGSGNNGNSDNSSNRNSRTDGIEDHSTKGLTKEERDINSNSTATTTATMMAKATALLTATATLRVATAEISLMVASITSHRHNLPG